MGSVLESDTHVQREGPCPCGKLTAWEHVGGDLEEVSSAQWDLQVVGAGGTQAWVMADVGSRAGGRPVCRGMWQEGVAGAPGLGSVPYKAAKALGACSPTSSVREETKAPTWRGQGSDSEPTLWPLQRGRGRQGGGRAEQVHTPAECLPCGSEGTERT